MKVYVNLNLQFEEAAAKADDFFARVGSAFEKIIHAGVTQLHEVFEVIKAEIITRCDVVGNSDEAEFVVVSDSAEALKLLATGKEVVQILYGQTPISDEEIAKIEGARARIHIYAIAGILYQGKYPGLTALIAFLANRLGSKPTNNAPEAN